MKSFSQLKVTDLTLLKNESMQLSIIELMSQFLYFCYTVLKTTLQCKAGENNVPVKRPTDDKDKEKYTVLFWIIIRISVLIKS